MALLLLLLTTKVVVHANNIDVVSPPLEDGTKTMANRLLQKMIHRNAPDSWNDVLLPAMEYSFLNKKSMRTTTTHPSHDEDNGRRRALQWLVFEDEASSTMSSHEYDTTLLQRYALATIYYTTGGDEWTYCSKAAGEGAEIEFNSPCEGGADSRFLSSKLHLLWGGVMGHDGQVTMLDISNRGLVSSTFLPPELLLLGPSLELLWVHDNIALMGSLPTYLNGNSFPSLASLSVHKTSMTGTIPSSIYTLSKLSSLRLYSSNFHGLLTSKIGQLTNLKWLWIHDNNFTGTVPVELGALSKLEGLTLHKNDFESVLEYNVTKYGTLKMNILPDTVCNLTKYDLRYLWTDCETNELVAAAVEDEDKFVPSFERDDKVRDETIRACSCCTWCFRQVKTNDVSEDANEH